MKRIIQAFDDRIRTILPGRGFYMPGLCELIKDDSSKYPVTIAAERKKVAIDDKFDGLLYHRVVSTSSSINDDYSFGLRIAFQHSVAVRTICAYRVDLGENLKYEIASAIPGTIRIGGFEFVNPTPNSFSEDHEAIVNEEFITIPYHKHRLPWNVFYFETNLEFVLCKNDCLQNV